MAHHDVVERIPVQPCLYNHGRRNQRRHQSPKRVAGMQESLNGVCLIHTAYPSAEASIRQSVTEAADCIGNNESRVWRMGCQNRVRDDVAKRSHDADAAATKGYVNAGIGECCEGVADEGG